MAPSPYLVYDLTVSNNNLIVPVSKGLAAMVNLILKKVSRKTKTKSHTFSFVPDQR